MTDQPNSSSSGSVSGEETPPTKERCAGCQSSQWTWRSGPNPPAPNTCSICESRSQPSSSSEITEAIDDLIRKAVFRGRDGYGESRIINGSYEERQKEVDAARSRLESLYLEQLQEVERLRADIEKDYSDIYKTQLRYREMAREATERYGFKEGELQWLWRGLDCFKRKYDQGEVVAAICDALTREGQTAWSGDGTSCVEQMVRLQWDRAEKAEAALSSLKDSQLTPEEARWLSDLLRVWHYPDERSDLAARLRTWGKAEE